MTQENFDFGLLRLKMPCSMHNIYPKKRELKSTTTYSIASCSFQFGLVWVTAGGNMNCRNKIIVITLEAKK